MNSLVKSLGVISVLAKSLQCDYAFQEQYNKIRDTCIAGMKSGSKMLIAGNGGSAAEASHFVAELVGRFAKNRRALPAMSLCVDPSVVTAWSNDVGFEDVFARQVEAYGCQGDILMVISTSGKSNNLLRAVATAKKCSMITMGLLGNTGADLVGQCDISLVVPTTSTSHIQEIHLSIIHALAFDIEDSFDEIS